ncbi:hypothetical protein RQN30_02355 [Arcanobacterium hippocoleae]
MVPRPDKESFEEKMARVEVSRIEREREEKIKAEKNTSKIQAETGLTGGALALEVLRRKRLLNA